MKKILLPTFFPLFLCLVTLCMFFITLKQPLHIHGNNTTYNVKVINGFTNNSSLPLVIWCATPETDMGGRALQEGDDYSWRVKPSYWGGGTNRVYCTLKWDQKRKKFDAFHAARDVRRCNSPLKLCLWLVKEHGFYFSSDGLVFVKEFSWT